MFWCGARAHIFIALSFDFLKFWLLFNGFICRRSHVFQVRWKRYRISYAIWSLLFCTTRTRSRVFMLVKREAEQIKWSLLIPRHTRCPLHDFILSRNLVNFWLVLFIIWIVECEFCQRFLFIILITFLNWVVGMVLDTFSQLSVDFVTSEMLGCGFLPVFIVSTFTLIRKVVLILVV